MQKALILKDIKGVTSNKRLFPVLLIVPLVLALVMPSIFVLTLALVPEESSDFQQMLELLPAQMRAGNLTNTIISLILNNVMPLFFLLIPIMAASVMAASSFVGEKEKRTLETLLYSPLSLGEIFRAKILASFLLSMLVSLVSFLVMTLTLALETWLLLDSPALPGLSWLVLLVLVSPGISLIAITIIVRGSAKAQTVEESQQRSVFLILPILLIIAGQFTGVILISPLLLLFLGAVLAAAAFFALKSCARSFSYESLL